MEKLISPGSTIDFTVTAITLSGLIDELESLAERFWRADDCKTADAIGASELCHLVGRFGEAVNRARGYAKVRYNAALEAYWADKARDFAKTSPEGEHAVRAIDENMAKTLRRIGSQEELLHVFRRYDRDGEFLIRSNGLEGEFRILRWRLDTENVIRRIEIASGADAHEGLRQRLLDDLLGNAAVSSESFITADTLSIRAVFKGIGAELIMVDRK